MRSGRLFVRAAAVAALLLAAVTTVVVVTRSGGATTPSSTRAAMTGKPVAKVAKVAKGTLAAAGATVTKPAVGKTHPTHHAKAPVKPAHVTKKPKVRVVVPAPHVTPVAILNGGTSQGAAAQLASRLRSLGYPVPVVGNAGRRDLPMAIEYSAGLGPAARALAKHVGAVQYVTPLEGPNRNLSGARLLVIIGN